MSLRFYLAPKVGTGTPQVLPSNAVSLPVLLDTDAGPFRPKYFASTPLAYAAMDYGLEAWMLVASDVTAAQHTLLAANSDVTAIPANLDSAVGAGALVTIQNKLEAIKVPGSWVTAATTYREVIGHVGRVFLLMQRAHGLLNRSLYQGGFTLNSLVSDLTVTQRNEIKAVAASLGLDTSFVTLSMTLRQVLRTWVLAMGQVFMAGEVF